MNSTCAHWVNTPLPPVNVGCDQVCQKTTSLLELHGLISKYRNEEGGKGEEVDITGVSDKECDQGSSRNGDVPNAKEVAGGTGNKPSVGQKAALM
jgi:hypothetical protein